MGCKLLNKNNLALAKIGGFYSISPPVYAIIASLKCIK
jgi:hypothetical protein